MSFKRQIVYKTNDRIYVDVNRMNRLLGFMFSAVWFNIESNYQPAKVLLATDNVVMAQLKCGKVGKWDTCFVKPVLMAKRPYFYIIHPDYVDDGYGVIRKLKKLHWSIKLQAIVIFIALICCLIWWL